MTKQTAVEWLENQIKTSKHYFKLMAEIKNRSTVAQSNIFQQAKEMEKEQIIEAFDEGQEYEYQYHINSTPKFDSLTYYNETFKQQ
jgi:hypothetical protein